MIGARRFDSASGLRPASAFVLIVGVLALVALWVGHAALASSSARAPAVQRERDPDPEYTIVDRDRRPLALFVQRLDLVLSPNAMWQAHTPEHMAVRIAQVLGLADPAELVERMLPDARDGVIEVDLALDPVQASRIEAWLATGDPAGAGESPPIDAMWIARSLRNPPRLAWRPAQLLSAFARGAQGERFASEPLRWSRHLADGLAQCLIGEDALAPGDDEDALEEQRALIWSHLMPSTWSVAVRGFDASRAPALLELFDGEHVAYHQMRIARERDRSYPLGRLQVLGRWGFIERPLAETRALADLGFRPEELAADEQRALAVESLSPEERRRFGTLAWRHLAAPIALSGLERACDLLLQDERWSFLDDGQASYSFRRDRSLRGKLARSYYLASNEASETPRVATTLDAPLQREVGRRLDQLMEEHRPAVAMAIAVDVASGDVLAVDAREAYELSGFAPLYHEFTPGSTFKVPVMACALESGAVTPDDVFDVGHGRFQIESRTITEAESARTGRLTVAECFAHSVNAGLVQIGTRVDPTFFRDKLVRLHYGVAPASGLGGERAGSLPPLPWKRAWEHASVSFGYELRMSLWQHAAALAAIVRGGEWLPLRIVDAVEQNGVRHDLARAEPEPVFSRATAETVRWMMEMGAREGTGRVVASPDLVPGLVVGTKTGTAQKVATEVCLHEELAHQAAHRAEQTSCSRACRRTLVGRRSQHRSCYTSSMCAFGRRAEGGREVLVLVVADEPRGREKFGARVAGPTAIAILEEALGATRLGQATVPDVVEGFAPSPCASEAGFAQPWAEEDLR